MRKWQGKLMVGVEKLPRCAIFCSPLQSKCQSFICYKNYYYYMAIEFQDLNEWCIEERESRHHTDWQCEHSSWNHGNDAVFVWRDRFAVKGSTPLVRSFFLFNSIDFFRNDASILCTAFLLCKCNDCKSMKSYNVQKC